MQQDLRVSLSAKHVAPCFERRTQLPVIVDLPIKGDDELAVGAHHRLRATFGKVDDCQPAMPKPDTLILRIPLAKAIGAARSHMIANSPQLGAIDRVGSVMIGVDAGDATHGWNFRRGSDAVGPQHRLGFGTTTLQTRKRGANALQALLVAPLQDAREARSALPPPQAFVFDQALESACKPVDVPGCRRIAVHAVPNEIGHTTYFREKPRREGQRTWLRSRQAPGFVFRRQHEYVRRGIKSGQLRLVDEAREHDVVECVSCAEGAQFLLKLSGTSHDQGKWAVNLCPQPPSGFE